MRGEKIRAGVRLLSGIFKGSFVCGGRVWGKDFITVKFQSLGGIHDSYRCMGTRERETSFCHPVTWLLDPKLQSFQGPMTRESQPQRF